MRNYKSLKQLNNNNISASSPSCSDPTPCGYGVPNKNICKTPAACCSAADGNYNCLTLQKTGSSIEIACSGNDSRAICEAGSNPPPSPTFCETPTQGNHWGCQEDVPQGTCPADKCIYPYIPHFTLPSGPLPSGSSPGSSPRYYNPEVKSCSGWLCDLSEEEGSLCRNAYESKNYICCPYYKSAGSPLGIWTYVPDEYIPANGPASIGCTGQTNLKNTKALHTLEKPWWGCPGDSCTDLPDNTFCVDPSGWSAGDPWTCCHQKWINEFGCTEEPANCVCPPAPLQ